MKVSIVIPNYNGEKLLKRNLPKVIDATKYYSEETKNSIEIIMVDDCSSDNSLLILKEFDGKINVLQNKQNLGFSSTVNRGVRNAKGEIVILLNTDVAPEKEFILPLVAHFKDNIVAAVGCMDKSIEGKTFALRGRGIGVWKRGLLVHRRGEVDKMNTLWVSGGSCAIRKSVWDYLGGFNPLYNPFYWEDIDFSYRCLKSGYKILFEQKSVVIHDHGSGAIKNKFSPDAIKTFAYRNQLIFAWLNITDSSLFISHIIWLPYHIVKAIFSGDSALLIGFFQAVAGLNKIMTTRTENKKLFVKTDKEVIDTINNA